MCDDPQHRSDDATSYIDSPKELRDSHRNAFSESVINCRGLNVCPIIADTPFRWVTLCGTGRRSGLERNHRHDRCRRMRKTKTQGRGAC